MEYADNTGYGEKELSFGIEHQQILLIKGK